MGAGFWVEPGAKEGSVFKFFDSGKKEALGGRSKPRFAS